MMRSTSLLAALIITVMILPVLSPLATAAYTQDVVLGGTLEEDRQDYMTAADNPLQEDIANYFFQGPGPISGSPSVGLMEDIENLVITNWATIYNMTYGCWQWESTPTVGEYGTLAEGAEAATKPTPLEGWAFYYYAIPLSPPTIFDYPTGVVVFTYSVINGPASITPNTAIVPDNVEVSLVSAKTLVNNSRLFVRAYTYSIVVKINEDRPETPQINETIVAHFKMTVMIKFNKATKFVEIKQKVDVEKIELDKDNWSITFDLKYGMARMAILDANPRCDYALYGWAFLPVNVTCPSCTSFYAAGAEMTRYAFVVLSWVNETIRDFVPPCPQTGDKEYFAAYALAFPAINYTGQNQLNFSYTIVSVMRSPDRAAAVNTWNPLVDETYYRAVYLSLYDARLGEATGDQALIRFDWWTHLRVYKAYEVIGNTTTGWATIVYGLYDVNGTKYDGGEGGEFKQGVFYDHNNVEYTPDTATEPTTGTLGYLLGYINKSWIKSREGVRSKIVERLDLNQNGEIEPYTVPSEVNISISWYPTEEFLWQFNTLFAPPTFSKLAEELKQADYIQISSTVLTTDVVAATFLAARFAVQGKTLIIFDIELYGVEGFPGYMKISPDGKAPWYRPYTKLPYLALKLTPINTTSDLPESVTARRAHYITNDGRIFLQMHRNNESTPWAEVHYFVVASGGPAPNLVTRYFNDFAALVFSSNNELGESAVVAPATGDVWLWSSVVSKPNVTDNNKAFGVIALARDHFNNTALIVWGARAPENYWLGYWLIIEGGLDYLINKCGSCSAVFVEINYGTNSTEWGTGKGIPLVKHSDADVSIAVINVPYSKEPIPAVYTLVCGPINAPDPDNLIQQLK